MNLNFLDLEAGRRFLNIVDDLEQLRGDAGGHNKQFGDLVDGLKDIARNDIPDIYFALPMLLTLLQLMNRTVTVTKAPDPQVLSRRRIAFTFEVR